MFIVVEIQDNNNDSAAVLTNSYEDRALADNKYYTVLAAAATSSVPIHSATMLTSEGYYIKSDCFVHEQEKEIK